MTVNQLAFLNNVTPDAQMSYPDRFAKAASLGVVLNVYRLREPGHPLIKGDDPAIVGLPIGDDGTRILVYFEGDIYGRGNDYADKLRHAAGRMVTRYPTVATAVLDAQFLEQTGTYDIATETFTEA